MSRASLPPLRLGHKLALAVCTLALLLAVLLLQFVGPRTNDEFLRGTGQLLAQSADAMHALTSEHARQSSLVLDELLQHTTTARHRALADAPLELFADLDALRNYVQNDDDRRAERLGRNISALAGETQRRADARIAAVLDGLQKQQEQLAATFADAVRTTHLVLCAGLLLVTLLLFGIGLLRLVVHPVGALRAATRRIAGGELGTDIAIASGDEIGALAADFRTMLAQLRSSQQALADLNRDLERKVDEKTRALAQAAKMASIGTLAGGIAHEFNNLIGGIRGCAREARADETDPERQQTLDVILRAGDRAAAITAQLRSFAQKTAPRAVDCALDQLLGDALHLLEPEARRRQVAIARDLSPMPCRGDDGALHQVFVNLVTNALQAMPNGGTLTVRGRIDGDQVVVDVTDTGVGISKADLDRVFEPFFSRRADDPDPAQRGTGLGLAVSYGIVDAHGGTISVQSEVGRGSTFTVRLPLRR